MPSILELLKQRQAAPQQPGAGVSQTAQVQALSQAKSGKAMPAGAAPVSNIGEQMAQQQAQANIGAINTQANLESAGQTQQALGQQQQTQDKLIGMKQAETQERDKLKLDQAKHDAYQQVFQKGLASEKLKLKIQQQAEKEGWEDQNKFEEDLQTDIFGKTRSNLFKNLGYKNMMTADQREWETFMSELSMGNWYDAAQAEMKAAGQKQQIEGAGKAGTAVAGYGAQKGWFESSPSKDDYGSADIEGSTGEGNSAGGSGKAGAK